MNTITTQEHERIIANMKIEEANRLVTDAFCNLWKARTLMKEAGVDEQGIAAINKAIDNASGFSPIEFMPDFPPMDRVSAYWDCRYVNSPADDIEAAVTLLKFYCDGDLFRAVEITPRKQGGFMLTWTFDNARIDELREAHK